MCVVRGFVVLALQLEHRWTQLAWLSIISHHGRPCFAIMTRSSTRCLNTSVKGVMLMAFACGDILDLLPVSPQLTEAFEGGQIVSNNAQMILQAYCACFQAS